MIEREHVMKEYYVFCEYCLKFERGRTKDEVLRKTKDWGYDGEILLCNDCLKYSKDARKYTKMTKLGRHELQVLQKDYKGIYLDGEPIQYKQLKKAVEFVEKYYPKSKVS